MFKIHKVEAYHPVCVEDTESLLPTSDESTTASTFQRRISSPYIITSSLVITILLIFGLGFCIGRISPAHLDQTCAKHTSKYCTYPLVSDTGSQSLMHTSSQHLYSTMSIFHTRSKTLTAGLYRRISIVKLAVQQWMRHGMISELAVRLLIFLFTIHTKFKTDRSILLPASRIQEAGLTSDHAHAREKYGGGYPVYVEGLHQLHCLVSLILRQLKNHADHLESCSAITLLQLWLLPSSRKRGF